MNLLFYTTAETDLVTLDSVLDQYSERKLDVRARNILRVENAEACVRKDLRDVDTVFIRVIGGREYVSEAFSVLEKAAERGDIRLVAVSAGHKPDHQLTQISNVDQNVTRAIDECIQKGGPENFKQVLEMLSYPSDGPRPVDEPPEYGIADEYQRGTGPTVAVLFYRAYHLSGDTRFIDAATRHLADCGFCARPIYLPGLRKEDVLTEAVNELLMSENDGAFVEAIVSFLGFSASDYQSRPGFFDQLDVPWIQWVHSNQSKRTWEEADDGLNSSDLSMKVIFPEFDGRQHGPAVAFSDTVESKSRLDCSLRVKTAHDNGLRRATNALENLTRLRSRPNDEKKIAVILGNHPTNRSRIGNGVGLDTPESILELLTVMNDRGYETGTVPQSSQQFMDRLVRHGSYDDREAPPSDPVDWIRSDEAREWIQDLPEENREALQETWGHLSDSPYVTHRGFAVPGLRMGNVYVGIQPPRGYEADPDAVYHSPDLPPPPFYVACYRWITRCFSADAIVHLGKHGTLEWLPGRSVAPGETDWPFQLVDDCPVLYPFIINDPGEGSQAKRRIGATIVDHMIAPQRKTELSDDMQELKQLLNGATNGGVPDKVETILSDHGLRESLNVSGSVSWRETLRSFLKDVDESPTRSGLHVLGSLPDETKKIDLIESLWPESDQTPSRDTLKGYWETPSDAPEPMRSTIVPALSNIDDEIEHVLDGLDGRYVPPGPSGAPTRGRPDLLPTGRNFYSRDARGMPTRDAWETGRDLADELAERHRTDTGEYPERIGVILWGTSNMRTGGEDVAQVLALMGTKPKWTDSGRVDGIEIIDCLDRPRIDPLVRVSGFFRDAFPNLIGLINEAVGRIVELEDDSLNYLRRHEQSSAETDPRIFGSKPGNYGAGILPLIESGHWNDREDLAEAFMEWGQYAYRSDSVEQARSQFERQLGNVDAVTQNRDSHEHDLFDSDDYFQFHGGMISAVESLSEDSPATYFSDTADPSDVTVRTLGEESARVFHSRISHQVWQDGMREHGYKGGFEMDATLDYVFGYDATTEQIPDSFYENMAEDFLLDDENRAFLEQHNPWAIENMGERLLEASERGLWESASDEYLDTIKEAMRDSETAREQGSQN